MVDHGNSLVRENVEDKLFEDVEVEYSKMLKGKEGKEEVEEGEYEPEEAIAEAAETAVDGIVEAAEQRAKSEKEEEAEPESREARKTKAEAYRRGQRKPVEGEEDREEVKEEAAPEAEKAEEPEAEEEKVEEEKPLLTQFTLKQGSQETEIPKDVTLDFKANNKEYKDVPLDKVVLWAQMGVYNEAREQEVQNAKKYVSEVGQYNKQLEENFNKLKGEVDGLLGDEAYYEAARNQWLRINTPEERARRAEEQLRQTRANEAMSEQKRQAQAYIQGEIFPAVEKILQAYKASVSEDEVMGRFNRLILPYMENGSVPPQLLPTVKQLVETELASWAQGVTMERDTKRKTQEEKTEKIVKSERVKSTLAKRELARTVRPQDGGGRAVKEAKKPKQYKSAQEWADTAMDEILSGGR